MSSPAQAVDTALLEEAADWIMTFRFDQASEQDQQAFERWRSISPAHGQAWARAQSVLGVFEQVPAGVGRDAIQTLRRPGRRRAMHALAAMLVATPLGLLAWRERPWETLAADAATSTGERKTMTLADGTRLVLNTASAVDIVFTATERRVHLRRGEILVSTGQDPSPTYRPFLVDTPNGTAQALGTRFSVRRLDEQDRLSVFEHAVEIRPRHGAAVTLKAGQQVIFGASGVLAPTPTDPGAVLWEQGMLVAKNMRLADVVAELARYRRGFLRCHPDVAELRMSGAISLDDTDAGLGALERTLPLRVNRLSRYWVTVDPA